MFNSTALIDFPDIFFETTQMMSIPALTPLYPLEPRCIGTGDCESLKSYICRLADSHRVSPTSLINEFLLDMLITQQGNWQNVIINTMKVKSHCISTGNMTKDMVNVLTAATGVEGLDNCTMLPLSHVVCTKGLLASGERHCPTCVKATNQVEPLHGYLLWELACVKACPIHGVQLQSSQCGAPKHKHLPLQNRKVLSGVCSTCGSIGYLCRHETPTIESDIEIWKARQIAEFISCFPIATQLFSPEKTIAGLKSLVNTFADGTQAIAARRAGIHKSVLWGWMHGHYLPSIGLLLDLCLSTGVSLTSVMKGQPNKCPSPHFMPDDVIKREQRATAKERENTLKEALEASPPLSLGAIAKKLGLCNKTLRNQFPEQVAIAVERYRQFASDEKDKRYRRAIETAQILTNKLESQKLPLTQRNFQNVLGKPLLPKSQLYRVLMEAKK
jgi:transcriptional regulator with XRE-family HTH domain